MEILEFIKYNFLMKFNENNIYINIIIVLVALINFLFNNFIYYDLDILKLRILSSEYFSNASTLLIVGEKTIKYSTWSRRQTNSYSDNFLAITEYLMKNNFNIANIEEDVNHVLNDAEETDELSYIFTTNQQDYFKITDDIFCKVSKTTDNPSQEKENSCAFLKQTETKIYLLSFNKNIYDLKMFLDNLTNKYNIEIQQKRNIDRYIYNLNSIDNKDNDDFSEITWNEHKFISNKNFDNLFIENKKKILKQIDFFHKNEDWYKNKGYPYSLGIGLYGPPGTGKTSFIKALANYLNRHLIIIPLNKINTEEQLFEAFYENRYNSLNKKDILFKDKIICFEDIDCMSNIVTKRENDNIKLDNIPEDIINNNDSDKILNYLKTNQKKNITLSCILNLLDGLIENYSRIVIITSNHYNKLDPALIRPGRIDIEINLENATVNQINNFYKYYYDSNIPKEKMKLIKDKLISPCEITNIYTFSENKKDFLDKIISFQEKKL